MLDRKIVVSAIIAYFLLALYAVYLKFFPTIISPEISNILFTGFLIVLLGILVIQPFLLKTTAEFYCVLPQYLFFAFISRAIPTLRFAFQPLEDPYYFFISTLNIADYGTLQPVLSMWYGLTQQQLTWPDLHLIGASLMNLTGVHSIELLRYILPAMGVIFFLGVFLLTKEITSNTSIALLAGLFASASDSVLFYQSEYHSQGAAFVYFVFLLVLIIRFFSVPSLLNGSLMIVYALIFSLSHHFSSVFFGVFSIFILITFWFFQRYLSCYFISDESKKIHFLLSPWVLIAFLMIFSHIFKYPSFLIVVSDMMKYQIEPMGVLLTYGSTIPFAVTILNSTKYILLALAIISILYIYKSKNQKEIFCCIFLIGIILSGIVGTFIAFIPVDRLIGFYIPFAALFAALTLYRFHNDWFSGWSIDAKKILILVVSLTILLAGPLNFFAPALIYHDTPRDPYYWHSNDFSGLSTFGIPGYWIEEFVPTPSLFTTNGNIYSSYTFMIPYFYGRLPENAVRKITGPLPSGGYVILDSYAIRENPADGRFLKKSMIYGTGGFNVFL